MRINRMTLATLAWAGLAVATAAAQQEAQQRAVDQRLEALGRARKAQPAAPNQQAKAPAQASDPAEPPLQVEVSYTNAGGVMAARGFAPAGRAGARVAAPAAAAGQAVKVASGAKGTVLALETPGAYSGTANLTFKAPPPMRFTMKLGRMPAYDLQALNITSGTTTLRVGAVGTSETTKYFARSGEALPSSTGAAYTVQAKRAANGEVEVQLRRGAGAQLGKAVSLSWESNLNRGGVIMFGGAGGMGGPGGIIISD